MLLLDTSIFTLALNYLHCFYGIFCHHSIFNNLLATKLFPVQFLILRHGLQCKVLKDDTNGWNFGPISPAGRIIMPWRNFRTSHKYRSNPNHTVSWLLSSARSWWQEPCGHAAAKALSKERRAASCNTPTPCPKYTAKITQRRRYFLPC